MPRHCLAIVVLATLALAAPALHAQQGRADLRYRVPLPDSITYVTHDSAWTVMSGTPMGDLNTEMFLRAESRLRFTPIGDSIDVAATLVALNGTATTPMGGLPITASNVPAPTMRMAQTGPGPETVMQGQQTPPVTPGTDIGAMLGAAKAMTALLALPGRELAVGETWTDTLRMQPEVEGLKSDMVMVMNGTYEADTVIDGTRLNVLTIRTDMTMNMAGDIQGMAMTQQMTSTGQERVLWNSARHHVVSRDGTGELRSEMSMPSQGMTMTMTGKTRSLAAVQSVH